MIIRFVVLFALAFSAALAQINELVVDQHGRIYFSALQSLKGGGLDRSEKVFLLEDGEVTAFAVREWEPEIATAASGPSVSADGGIVAYTLSRFRPMWPPDPYAELEGVIRISSRFAVEEIRKPARVRISANGRWALFTPAAGDGTARSWWLNLETREEVPASAWIDARWVADDGTAVTAAAARLLVFTPGQTVREISTVYSVDSLRGISRDGSRACVSLLGAGLAVVDLKTGFVDVVMPPVLSMVNVLMSPDGSGFYIFATGPANGVTPGSKGIVWFDLRTREPEILAESTAEFYPSGASISPCGRRLFFFSHYAGIVEFDIEARRFSGLLAERPSPGYVPEYLTPASWLRLGVTAAAGETRVLIGGLEPAVYFRFGNSLVVVPDPLTPLGESEIRLVNDASPFEPEVRPVVVALRVPLFVILADLGPQDSLWSSVALIFDERTGDLINPWRPVRPDEVLRVYLTGIVEGPEHVEWSAQFDGLPAPAPEVLGIERDPNLPAWWIARIRVPSVSRTANYRLCLTPTGPLVLRSCTSFPVTPD